MADDFSVTQHVQRLVTSSAETNYALRVLRCHDLSNAALQLVYLPAGEAVGGAGGAVCGSSEAIHFLRCDCM